MKGIRITLLLASILLLTACEQAEITLGTADTILNVEVSTEGFTPTEGSTTRASENHYQTEFINGDQIGVTMVKGGKIVDEVDNICFTYDTTTKKWTTDSELPLSYYQDVTYLAYYPYDAGMNGKVSEQEIIDAFTPQTDQSTYANYTKSDLMVATGIADPTAKTLTLPFRHAMAMVAFGTYTKKFVTPGGFSYDSHAPYALRSLTEMKITIGAKELKPCLMNDGTIRIIVYPNETTQTIKIQYRQNNLMEYTDNTLRSLESGKYIFYKFNLQDSSPYVRELQLGDFFYVDGTFYPGSITEDAPDRDNCLGVVSYVGTHWSKTVNGVNYNHGTVLAKKNAWGGTSWLNANSQQYAKNYTPAGPSNTSGWYWQDKDELQYLCSGVIGGSGVGLRNTLNPYMQRAGGTAWENASYWSKSEKGSGTAYNIYFTGGNIYGNSKSNYSRIRSSLAF